MCSVRRLRLSCLLAILSASPLAAEDWPEFRGPDGQGHSAERNVPVEWAPDKNIRWKTPIPGLGWSTPVCCGGHVYLTTAVPVEDAEPNDQRLVALCLDAKTGKIAWQRTVFEQRHDATEAIHGKNSHASPSPVTDGRHLWVHFGTQGTACLTLDGEIVWTNRELEYAPVHGGGGSPVLVEDLLVVNCDGSDAQFMAALDSSTGKVRWQKDRPPLDVRKKFSFATPLVIRVDGEHQIVSPAAGQVVSYRPADGQELWRFPYEGYSVVPRPVFGHGLLFLSSSFDQPTLYALRVDGDDSPEPAWSTAKGAPHTASPLLVGKKLFVVSDRGVATCLDAKSGEVHWVERLGGNFSASPVAIDGHVYFQNEDGGTVVIRPGETYEEVARNSLPGQTLASFAVSDGSILLRTDTHLYRIGRK